MSLASRGHIGSCIYCGSTDPPLTAEHIIPEALGGTEYLTAATCETCRKETANAENVIGLSISPLLRRLGVKGKKKWTKTIRLKGINHKGQSFSTNRDILKTGLLAALSTSNEPPRMMTGAPQSNEIAIINYCDIR
jgi:HNH endonuclease